MIYFYIIFFSYLYISYYYIHIIILYKNWFIMTNDKTEEIAEQKYPKLVEYCSI